MGSHFGGIGEFTTHFRTVLFSGWIGMFTGGTIWLLTHSHMGTYGLLEFAGESNSFQGFLGGAKWISSIHSSTSAGCKSTS